MFTDAALVALWIAAMVFAIWHCHTSERRHNRRHENATRRRLMLELARHNADLYEQQP